VTEIDRSRVTARLLVLTIVMTTVLGLCVVSANWRTMTKEAIYELVGDKNGGTLRENGRNRSGEIRR
jgi:hypothetical protein